MEQTNLSSLRPDEMRLREFMYSLIPFREPVHDLGAPNLLRG